MDLRAFVTDMFINKCITRILGDSMRKVQVTFTDEQWEIISKLRGKMGSSDSEVVRMIVLAWLAEKSIIASAIKEADGGKKG